MGPEKSGLPNYLGSMKRLKKALNDMQASNIRTTQQTISDLQRLIKMGNAQLANHYETLLRGETPPYIEPLHFLTKKTDFPIISQDKVARLGLINTYMAAEHRQSGGGNAPQESPTAKIYADVRGPYIADSLKNLAAASINTTRKKDPNAIYRRETNGVSTYAAAMEGMLFAEHDNICNLFTREDWTPLFLATVSQALSEFGRTLRELNNHIKTHISTDCFLAYEIVELISAVSSEFDKRIGELKESLANCLKPVRETAKMSLGELLNDTRRRVAGMQSIPLNGAPIPLMSETVKRLQNMVEFLRPLSSIMVSLGDGGWNSAAASRSGVGDGIPSLASFDIGADGKEIFAHYCEDTLDTLLTSLEERGKILLGRKPVVGIFLANGVTIMERMIIESDLAPLLEGRTAVFDKWRKKAKSLYSESTKDVCTPLFDTIHTTSKSNRPTSGQGAIDSASVLKGLSSKEKENIKNKFTAFNASFDELVAKHKQYQMEREVRQMVARDAQQMIEPMYNRFWDRYHEVDKGKGKYVKYDKSSISAVFLSLY